MEFYQESMERTCQYVLGGKRRQGKTHGGGGRNTRVMNLFGLRGAPRNSVPGVASELLSSLEWSYLGGSLFLRCGLKTLLCS